MSLDVNSLPEVRGSYRSNSPLKDLTWFRVGGKAEVLFKPKDVDDLQAFLKAKPENVEVTFLGVGSNMIVRDGGIKGVVIRLGSGFNLITVDGMMITAGAAALDAMVARHAQRAGIGGLEFYFGVPGTIGGALRMNAGAHGGETKDILVSAKAVDPDGNLHELTVEQLKYSYRRCSLPSDWIFVEATFAGQAEDPQVVKDKLDAVQKQRETTQPIREKTGGSTFKNPPGHSSWKLVDAAGCRGFSIGDAQVSEMHCNFLINQGMASAFEIESLGEEVRKRVFQNSGVLLDWEIKRVGDFKKNQEVKSFEGVAA